MAETIKTEAVETVETEKVETEEVGTEEEKNYGRFEINLRKPLKTADGEVSKLEFNFEALSGADGLAVEQEIRTLSSRVVLVQASDTEYLIKLACKACSPRVNSAAVEHVSINDFNKIVAAMRGFLLRSE